MGWYKKAQTATEVDVIARSKGYSGPFWHGTSEVRHIVRDSGTPKDPAALKRVNEIRDEFMEIGRERFPDVEDWESVPVGDIASVLQRWKLFDLAQEMRDTLRQAHGQFAKESVEPSFTSFQFGEFGFHFGTKSVAEMMGHAFPFYLKMDSVFRLPDLGTWNWQLVVREFRERGIRISEREYDEIFNAQDEEMAAAELILSKGVDTIVYKNEVEGFEDSYLILSSQQIKLAFPVTYDDDGSLIPLSDRFDSSNPDFRY